MYFMPAFNEDLNKCFVFMYFVQLDLIKSSFCRGIISETLASKFVKQSIHKE